MKITKIFLLSGLILGTLSPIGNTIAHADISNDSSVLKTDTTYSWKGVSVTLDESGILHIKGGTVSNPVGSLSTLLGNDISKVNKIVFEEPLTLDGSMYKMFTKFINLTEIDGMTNVNTNLVTNMQETFSAPKLTKVDLSEFDTSNVDTMQGMFATSQIEYLNLENFNTSKVQYAAGMFRRMPELKEVNVSSFDTSQIQYMSYMFSETPNLEKIIGLNTFVTHKVVSMPNMFANSGIYELDLSSFDMANVRDSTGIIANDLNLKVLKLGLGIRLSPTVTLALSDLQQNDMYTGKWQNVGEGTEDKPSGNNVWNSNEFETNYIGSKDAGTYVWQPTIKGQINVRYVDDTTGEDILSQPLQGIIGQASDYSTTDTIKALENKGYELVSDDFPTEGVIFNNEFQSYTIHLKHKTTTITSDNPGAPGTPMNPNDPEGVKWPNGTDKDSLTRTINETIHYIYEDGSEAAKDVVDSATFSHEEVVDNVTGKIVEDHDWTYTDKNYFSEKNSPTIDGYTPDRSVINKIDDLSQDSTNIEETVTYKKTSITPVDPINPTEPVLPVPNNPGLPNINGEKGITTNNELSQIVNRSGKTGSLPNTGLDLTTGLSTLGVLIAASGVTGYFVIGRKKSE